MSADPAHPARSLVIRLLERHCERHGLRLVSADEHGHAGLVERPDGRRFFFKGTRFDLNPLGAAEIAADKAYTAFFLKAAGLTAVDGLLVQAGELSTSNDLPETVRSFTQASGFPVFVKPNTGREGRDVFRVDTFDALRQALRALAGRHETILIQPEVRGREVRVLVLDGNVLCALERRPPEVTGDGTSPISELIRHMSGIDPADSRIGDELARQSRTPTDVPAPGENVRLLPVANLSSGGSVEIITESVSPNVLSTALRAVNALALRYAAVDFILPEAGAPEPAILEVNAAPGIGHLARQGDRQAALAEGLYEKVFSALFRA